MKCDAACMALGPSSSAVKPWPAEINHYFHYSPAVFTLIFSFRYTSRSSIILQTETQTHHTDQTGWSHTRLLTWAETGHFRDHTFIKSFSIIIHFLDLYWFLRFNKRVCDYWCVDLSFLSSTGSMLVWDEAGEEVVISDRIQLPVCIGMHLTISAARPLISFIMLM